MILAPRTGWRAGTEPFAGLSPAERRELSRWLRHCSAIGGVEDLSRRPWNVTGTGTVLGVFKTGRDRASWLLIHDGHDWTVGSCDTGLVSNPPIPLHDVLALIAGAGKD